MSGACCGAEGGDAEDEFYYCEADLLVISIGHTRRGVELVN